MTTFSETENEIDDPYTAFNYATWTPNTQVTLTNVPWNSDYRDIVQFDNQGALNKYIDDKQSANIRMQSMTYHRPGRPIKIEVPLGRALKYNYLRAHNPAQPVPGNDQPMTYYYFITEVEHVAPNTTAVYLQLDVVQTYLYSVRFGQCFVESGHIGIANENQFINYGREYLTIPEGLDVGGEYQISDVHKRDIASARAAISNDARYNIIVTSNVSLVKETGDVNDPQLNSAVGSSFANLPNGAEAYLFDNLQDFRNFLVIYSDKPWITQGITSIKAVPANLVSDYGADTLNVEVNGVTFKQLIGGTLDTKTTSLVNNWRILERQKVPVRYRHLWKFQTYPYMVLELTSHTGTPIIIKPESWNSENAEVVEVAHFAEPGARLAFYPYRYNAASTSPVERDEFGVVNDGGEFLDMATGIFNFPTFSTLNNSYVSFMASNSNSLAYQHSSADWSQQRAQTGNQLAYNQASAGMGLSNDLSQQGINAQQRQANLANSTAAFRGAAQAVNGVVGSLTPGQAIGSVANTAVGTAIGMHQTHESMQINTGLAEGSNASSVANQGYMRDTNKAYADYASQGDYENTIKGINAKIQDAQMIQPTTAGQVGGDAFLLASYRWGYDLKIKTLDAAAMARVGETWLRYGYQVNRFMQLPQQLNLMRYFTYWKLKETYILEGNFPESFKVALRGIFEKGVTVWVTPDYIGRVDIGENYAYAGTRY